MCSDTQCYLWLTVIVVYTDFFLAATDARIKYIISLNYHRSVSGHVLRRKHLFKDVLDLYRCEDSDMATEYPLHVKFEGERAVDHGGVSRDMLSAFWELAYKQLFDGGNLLSPTLDSCSDTDKLSIVGYILSHGFLATGILPVRLAFPSLVSMLLGPKVIVSDSVMLSTFVDSISSHESLTIKEALSCDTPRFSEHVTTKIVTVLSRYGCRKMPQPHNLKRMLIDIALI